MATPYQAARYAAVKAGKLNGWDGPVALAISGQNLSGMLHVQLQEGSPRRTGRGVAAYGVVQRGGSKQRLPQGWRIRVAEHLMAQNFGAEIPDRPVYGAIRKDGKIAKTMHYHAYGKEWFIKPRKKVKGYTIKARGFIERAIDDFADRDLATAIGWAE